MRRGKLIYTGQNFGHLTVINLSDQKGKKNESLWNCKCICGKVKPIRTSKLNSGEVNSCGCKQHSYGHGLSKSSEYHIWQNMRERCNNSNHPRYKDYGGRGIKVCKQWDKSFNLFYCDMGARPSSKHTIERINNDGNYEPNNCKWEINANQSKNRRNTRKISFKGEVKCLKDWAIQFNLHPDCLRQRLNSGWPIEKALTTLTRF